MTLRILRLFINQMSRILPEFTPLIQLILHCNLKQRKCILSLSRIQAVPTFPRTHDSPISYAYRQLSEDLTTLVNINGTNQSLHYCLATFSPLFSTPVSAGLINMLVRNLPLPDEDEYRQEILSGIKKEIRAAVNKYHPTTFNWDAILLFCVPSKYLPSSVFHPDYPFNRETYARISSGFVRSIRTFENSLFFPSLGTKSMGQIAYLNYEKSMLAVQDVDIPLDHVTPLAAEICMYPTI